METKNNELEVGRFSVNARGVLGMGGFGIVYTAKDPAKEETIAAKRIDLTDKRKAEKITRNLDKLLHLSHPNVLQYFEIVREQHICWIFMEYCPFGDLTKIFATTDVIQSNMLEAMAQAVNGLKYLHENSIIHRDIKPANILVASSSPLALKLTDFDLSKFLGENYDTSKMNSNVGTAAFKAPEFFLRNDQRKIEYHRSVDIYALGLTYLAMIQGNKHLIPKLETFKFEAEIHIPIGSTMATRLRYGEKPLTVIATKKDPSVSRRLRTLLKLDSSQDSFGSSTEGRTQTDPGPVECKLRELVQQMTHISPEERPSASDVLETLRRMSETNHITLVKQTTWNTELTQLSMFASGEDKLVIRGKSEDGKRVLQVCNRKTGEILMKLTSLSNHHNCINEVPNNPNCVLEACGECNVVRVYNLETKTNKTFFQGCNPWRICTKSDYSVLVITSEGLVHEIDTTATSELKIIFTKKTDVQNALRMCYDLHSQTLIVTDLFRNEHGRIQSFSLEKDGSVQWELLGEVKGQGFHPRGVCCNNKGLVFVGDWSNSRLLVLNSLSGDLLQTIPVDMVYIWKLEWSQNKPELTIHHESDAISCFSVEETSPDLEH